MLMAKLSKFYGEGTILVSQILRIPRKGDGSSVKEIGCKAER